METLTSLTDSTTKCSDITDVNILNTSDETPKQKPISDLPTGRKLLGPDENQSGGVSLKLAEPYSEFLITDLKSWIFKMRDVNDQEHEYTARNCPVEDWKFYFSEYANLDPAADWSDLEERADFLTQLWSFCYEHTLSFPLTKV